MPLARAFVLLAVMLVATVAGADRIGDLLFDLHLTPLDGQSAPSFSLPGLDGKQVSLADYKDHVVFLYFWASW
jgi:hypothetical protein